MRNQFESITVDLVDITLWPDNPRLLTGQADEMQCIEQLLEDFRFMVLLEDVAKNGLGIAPIVLSEDRKDENRFVVRDGNRRIASLKLLNNPELCPADLKGIKKKIESIAKTYQANLPSSVECLYSDDEDAIKHHLVTTHTGEQGGLGQVGWDALMQAAFDYDYKISSQYTLSYRFLLLGKSYGFKINDGFPITTLVRLPLSDFCTKCRIRVPEDIHEAMSIEDNSPHTEKAILRILQDVESKTVNVKTSDDPGSVRGAGKPKAYVEKIIDEYKANIPFEGAVGDGDQGDKPVAPDTPTAPTPKRSPKLTQHRNKLVPARRVFKGVPAAFPKEKNIFAELTKLSSKDAPMSSVVMLRVFFEATMKKAVKALGMEWKSNKSLGAMTALIAEKLLEEGDINKPQRDLIVKLSGKGLPLEQKFFTVDTIQQIVHSSEFHPDRDSANHFWDQVDVFIAKCWDRVAKNATGTD